MAEAMQPPSPDFDGKEQAFARLLRSCKSGRDLSGVRRVHARIAESDHRNSTFLANQLIHIYGRLGRCWEARATFDSIARPNLYSWNIMISAYVVNGAVEKARMLFSRMPRKTVVAATAVIEGLGHLGLVANAGAVYESIKPYERDLPCQNAMLAAFARNGYLQETKDFLSKMPVKNSISWTTPLLAYAQRGHLEQAQEMFDIMEQRTVVAWTAMISGYAHHGYLKNAVRFFEKMPSSDAVSWSVMVSVLVRQGRLEHAIEVFDSTPYRTSMSWAQMFRAYFTEGEMVRAAKVLDKMPHRDEAACNAMIKWYLHLGSPQKAKSLFESLPDRDLGAWEALNASPSQA